MKDHDTPFESVAGIPALVDAKDYFSLNPLTIEQAITRVRNNRTLVLGRRSFKNSVAWTSGDAERPVQEPTTKEQEHRLALAFEQTCEEVDARAMKALEALTSDEARGKVVVLLDRAANEAWANTQTLVTSRHVKARQRAEKLLKRVEPHIKPLQRALLSTLENGGDELPGLKLVEKSLHALGELEKLMLLLLSLWKQTAKEVRSPGKAATPALNEATEKVLQAFKELGLSNRAARIHTHALLRASGLSNSDEPATIKAKLSTL